MSPVTIDDLNTPMVANVNGASSVAIDDLELDKNLAAKLEQGLEEEEIAELEHAIRKKCADLDSAPNPIIRCHLEDMIK
ncbi:hypothetical protein H4S07_000456 [Coemansia furcata]|uniref:Uncharacterized protein n=1 Tax=Coemansia furcata TaxID=417177 RepID=A0ACC1LS90_9FUNG|nr:hypothetical protein H4S07_000456 [Coemansia furcata]